jgi:hypothetical protein
MDLGEPADLPSCEARLRGALERIRAAFNDEYPETITRTLQVMPDLLEQLNLLNQIIEAHLAQLVDEPESMPKQTALEELQEITDRVLQARTNVLAAASLANEAREARDHTTRLQTHSELQEERTVAGPWEAALIKELRAAIGALHQTNKNLSLGQVNLPKPDQGGGAMARNKPEFVANSTSCLLDLEYQHFQRGLGRS